MRSELKLIFDLKQELQLSNSMSGDCLSSSLNLINKTTIMKWLLTLLILLTACQSHPVIPAGDPGQVVAHFEFVELPDGKGDTLKCITYSLKNESQYDYYILWPDPWGLLLTTHLGDTSCCNAYLSIAGLEFYRLNDDLSRPYIDEKYREQIETVLRPYL